ncbi:MAG: B12-binding domain-containing radical SAM protein [Candidatus Thorarchaeota archaeon]
MSRYVLREHNAIKKDISKVDILFGYCYPSTYRAGMTGLATHLFYSILNSRVDTSCERYFRYDVPSPGHSVESGRALRDNHIVGFSLTFEEDIINLIQMLKISTIPVTSSERTENDPIVIVGGPVSSSNPEPYVDFIDAFVIGEGDYVINEIIDSAKNSSSRYESVAQLSKLKGVYVPAQNPTQVERLIVDDLDNAFHPTMQVIPDIEVGSKLEPVFGRTLLVEVSRGCGHSCKFCLVGHICRPRRVRSLKQLEKIIEIGLDETPVKKIALIASSLGDLDQLGDLAAWIVNQDLELSVPSLRADSVTLDLLKSLQKGGQKTLTIAPETGSESLRKQLGKGLKEGDIFNAVEMAKEAGYRAIKTYFIIGLPDETDDDVLAIASMVERIASKSKLRVTASVNPFIPKAHTRWERMPQPPIEELRRKNKLLEKSLRNVARVELETLDPRNARIQAALSMADRTIGKLIRIAADYGGLGGWRRAQKETNIPFFSLANEENRYGKTLPWSFMK